MAQARLQAALTEITGDLPFRNPIIQAGIGRLPEAPGVWQAQAQFSGLASDGAELEVIRAIAQWPRKLVVDRLQGAAPRRPDHGAGVRVLRGCGGPCYRRHSAGRLTPRE